MKLSVCLITALAAISLAQAQGMGTLPASDLNLTNVQTPTLLGTGHYASSIDLRYFGGYDKTLRGGLWVGYGLYKNFEVDLAGSFSKWNSDSLANGDTIRFGGDDEEASLRYRLPITIPATVEAGIAYVQTPAQAHRLAGTLGGSIGYSPISKLRVYLNPKAVFLDRNSLFGIGVGASVDIWEKLSLIGDWTPLVAGDNSVDAQTGGRDRGQIYSIALRYSDVIPHGSVDFGVTNSSGMTTGSSLTPSLGDSPSLFARFTYRF